MASVFIKRHPSKGELPETAGYYDTNVGRVFYVNEKFDRPKKYYPSWWLEEVELPTDDEIDKSGDDFGSTHIDGAFAFNAFMHGANFILNKLKGETK